MTPTQIGITNRAALHRGGSHNRRSFAMDQKLEDLQEKARDYADNARFKMAEVYGQAEGFIAKVKLFFMLNSRKVVILIATHFAAVMVGMLF